jgi:hypothetical protein
MPVRTYEAIVENGKIRLSEDVRIPDHTKVYVVVPVPESTPRVRILTPHLANPAQLADFVKEVSEA